MRVFKSKEEVLELNKNKGEEFAFYDDLVINLKNFKHPGPQNIITNAVGTDFKNAFINQKHSKHANYLLNQLKVGVIATDENFFQPKFATELNEQEELIHRSIDSKIDMNKPILPQIPKLTKEEFMHFVTRPRYIEGFDNIQILEDKWSDTLSKTPIIFNILGITPIILYFLYQSVKYISDQNSISKIISDTIVFLICLFLSCCLVWTFIEYYFHRFLLHPEGEKDFPDNPSPELLQKIFNMHLKHHTFINQKHRIALSVPRVWRDLTIIYLILMLIFNPFTRNSLMLGASIGVLGYDLMHYWIHFGGDSWFQILEDLRAGHMRHHYRHKELEFGVTSRLWDYVFKTNYKEKS